jgi:hypothetical protein
MSSSGAADAEEDEEEVEVERVDMEPSSSCLTRSLSTTK